MSVDRDTWERAAYLSEVCPTCGRNCGVADYDPPDPEAGIWHGTFYNECRHCGWFTTSDDGWQEHEKVYDEFGRE